MLAHSLVVNSEVTPTQWAFFLHGILGSGSNLRSLARACVAAAPSWGVILVDLRMHGQSQNFKPPHTLEATASDLVQLATHLDLPIQGVLGHSFGGKVAMHFMHEHRSSLKRVWVLDASPSINKERFAARLSAPQVLAFLERLPKVFASKQQILERVQSAGYTPLFAQWLATNYERCDEGLQLRINLKAIEEMLEGYWQEDYWSKIEQPLLNGCVHYIIGELSDAVSSTDRERLVQIEQEYPNQMRLHTIANAGHWLHIDQPYELQRVLNESFKD